MRAEAPPSGLASHAGGMAAGAGAARPARCPPSPPAGPLTETMAEGANHLLLLLEQHLKGVLDGSVAGVALCCGTGTAADEVAATTLACWRAATRRQATACSRGCVGLAQGAGRPLVTALAAEGRGSAAAERRRLGAAVAPTAERPRAAASAGR